jgi:hypothetical protein
MMPTVEASEVVKSIANRPGHSQTHIERKRSCRHRSIKSRYSLTASTFTPPQGRSASRLISNGSYASSNREAIYCVRYTAVIEDQENSSIRPLIDWLDYNGYTVVTKATKEFVDQTGRRKVKGNMDIELAVDAIELAPHIDQMVLFSGDGDFCLEPISKFPIAVDPL